MKLKETIIKCWIVIKGSCGFQILEREDEEMKEENEE